MKKIGSLIAVLFIFNTAISAKGAKRLKAGETYVTPSLGLGAYSEASSMGLYAGVNAEHMLDQQIGVGGSIGYISASSSISSAGANVTASYGIVPIMLSAVYHYPVVTTLDTFAGLGIGYHFGSISYEASSGTYSTGASASFSGVAYNLFGGARYFLAGGRSLNVKIGWGEATPFIHVGIDLKL